MSAASIATRATPLATDQSRPEASNLSPDLASKRGTDDFRLTVSVGQNNVDSYPVRRCLSLTHIWEWFKTPDASRGRLGAAEYHALDKTDPKQKALRNAEKNGEYFIAATFGGDGRRRADNIESLSGFVLDFDSGRTTRATIEEKLEGLTFVAYTSYSHQSSAERWRVFIPYPCPIEPGRHRSVFEHFNTLFDGDLDASCGKPAQLYYTPACPHDVVHEFECLVNDGDLFDPTSIPAVGTGEGAQAATVALAGPGPTASVDIDRLKDALDHLDPDPRDTWIDVGMAIKHDLGEAGLPIWIHWSQRSSKFEPVEAVNEWQSLKPKTGAGAVTCGSVFYWAAQAGWGGQATLAPPTEIAELNDRHFVAAYGRKVVVFRKSRDPVDGGSRFEPMAQQDFKLLLQNRTVQVPTGNGALRSLPLASYWLGHPQRRQYEGVLLSPGQDVPDHFNLWQGFAVEPKRGSWKRMRQHLLKAICGGDRRRYRYLLNWMAYAVQYPGRPAEVALVMRGGRGAGKGLVGRTLGALYGPHFLQITQPGHLTGHFNGHLESTVLLFVDEGFWAGDKAGEGVLKGLITEPTMSIERKGLDVVRARNCLHIIIASNSDWVVPAGPDERRYFILDVDDSNKQDPAYFKPIYDEMAGEGLAAMLFDLQKRDLCSFDIRHVPQTRALGEQKLQSLSPTDKWWFDKLVVGTFFTWNFGQPFECGWAQVLTGELHSDYVRALQRSGTSRKSTEAELGRRLTKLLPPGKYRVRATVDKQQAYYYKFPPIEDCRAHFEKLLKLEGGIDWTTGGLHE